MRNLLLVFLLLCSLDLFAQKEPKIDSVYYLVDTAKIPINARMLDLETDGPLKYYIINCVCIKSNGKPSFSFDSRKTKSIVISRKELKSLRLVNLPDLLSLAKLFIESEYKMKYAFFIVEPEGEKFAVRSVRVKAIYVTR